MSDATSSDIEKLIEAMQANTAAMLRRGGSGASGGAPQDKKFQDAEEKKMTATKLATKAITDQVTSYTGMDKVIKDVNKTFKKFDDDIGLVQKSLLAASTVAGALVSKIASEIPGTVKTYRELMDVGQDFGGSMLMMNKAAAQSRMSLDDFAKTIKKYNYTIASVGTKSFMDMGVGLRDSLSQVGMLGLTTEQLTEYLGDYMDTQRAYGNLERLSQGQAVDSTRNFVDNITKFSALTGKSRADIMKATKDALQDSSLAAFHAQLSGKASQDLTDSLGKATAYMAALPGKSGDMMARMLAQAVGRESAWLSDEANKLSSVGLGSIVDMVDSMAAKVKNGTASDEELDAYRAKMVKVGKENMESLRIQSMSNNASTRENAAAAIQFINEMSNLSKKTLQERKEQEKITNTLLRMQDIWSRVTNFVREQFMGPLGSVLDGFEESMKSKEFGQLKDQIISYGSAFAKWLQEIAADKETWVKLGRAVGVVVDGIVILSKAIGAVVNVFNSVASVIGTFGAAMAGLAAYLVATKGIAAVKDKLSQKFNIGNNDPFRRYAVGSAIRVVVANGGGGGFGSDDHWERRQRRTERVRRGRRAQNIGRVAGRGVAGAGRVGRAAGGAIAGGARKAGGLMSGAAGKLRGMSNVGKGLAGGVGGLLMVGADMALEQADDFAGKSLAKLGLAAAQGAATGAMIAGPWGAAAGAIVGTGLELVSNWDGIVKDLGAVADFALTGIKKGFGFVRDIFGWFGKKLTGIWSFFADGAKSVFNGIVDFGKDIGSSVGKTVSDGFTSAVDWMKTNITSFATTIGDAWNSILNFDWSGMFGKIGSGIADFAIKGNPIASIANMAIGGISKAMNPGQQVSGPQEKGIPSMKTMESKAMETYVKGLETQMDALRKENSDLRQQFNKLYDLLAESNLIQRAGLGELVDETKRGNRAVNELGRRV